MQLAPTPGEFPMQERHSADNGGGSSGPLPALPLDSALQGLHPDLRIMLEQFQKITQIPRASGHEEQMRDYLISLAQENGWAFKADTVGNLVVDLPSTGRGAGAAPIALQAHMDMVCVPEDFPAIRLKRSQREVKGAIRDVLTADGTTLGADNGIGIAAILALALDKSVEHPPLQLVFTVEEETGLTGVFGIDPAMIKADWMLNLDSEEYGTFYISSAGGCRLETEWRLNRVAPSAGQVPIQIELSGFLGGHSGAEIHKPVGNPIKILAAALSNVRQDISLASISGGIAHNVIPTDASAVIWIEDQNGPFKMSQILSELSEMLPTLEGSGRIKISVGPCVDPQTPFPFDPFQSSELLQALSREIPHGVLEDSDIVPGLVQTSNNLARIRTGEETVTLLTFARSSREGAITEIHDHIIDRLRNFEVDATHRRGEPYPAWEADLENPLLKQAVSTYQRLHGNEPAVAGIHAGLECGMLAARVPGLKAFSCGPDLLAAHSDREAVVLDTLHPFWQYLKSLLEDFCGRKVSV